MVVPPALMAATPVGATIAVSLPDRFLIYRRKVVLPVPALPVKKIERFENWTKSAASLKVGEMSGSNKIS